METTILLEINANEQTKCGEIFRSEMGQLNYVCTMCTEVFDDYVEFETHIVMHFAVCTDQEEHHIDQIDGVKTEMKNEIEDYESSQETFTIDDDHQEMFPLETRYVIEMKENASMLNCNLCNQQFQCAGQYVSHYHIHGIIKRYECEFCPASFDTTKQAKVHRRLHGSSSINSVMCEYCAQIVSNQSELERHLTGLDHQAPTGASRSRKSRKKSESMKNEISKSMDVDEIEGEFILTNRNADNVQEDDNVEEEDSAAAADVSITHSTVTCAECAEEFQCIGLRERHGRVHGKFKPYACKLCTASFDTKLGENIHKKLHTSKSDTFQTTCPYCKQIFRTKSQLVQHLNADTTAIDSVFENLEKMTAKSMLQPPHMTTTTTMTTKAKSKKTTKKIIPMECDYCGHVFRDRTNLVVHMRVHTGAKPYDCPLCGKMFTQSSYVKIHLRRHKNERPYQCNECGKRFFATSALTVHMRSHTNPGVRYQCVVCPRKYKRVTDLQLHIRQHTGERPYQCDVCGQQFVKPRVLKQHQELHLTERRYTCKYNCGMSFAQLAGKYGHEKRTHESGY